RQPRHLPARRGATHPPSRAADPRPLRRRAGGAGAAHPGGARMSGRLGQAVSNVLAVAYRQALVLRHDMGFILSVMFQPIVLLLLYGLGISFKPANVPWAVLDRTQTTASRRLIEDIQTTGYFRQPKRLVSYAEARTTLRRGRTVAVLVVPHDFARDLERGRPPAQLLLDGTDPHTAPRARALPSQLAASFTA